MSWFNYYGLIIFLIIMIPNIVYSMKHNENISSDNKILNLFEQIGRYGCIAFLIFNIPYTYFNFWFENALIVYLLINGCLCFAYLLVWIVFWSKDNMIKKALLSILPSCIFIFSGVLVASIPLIIFSIIFAISHITISINKKKC